MKTYLVSGASGFVGSALVPELERAGARVVCLVRQATTSAAGVEVLAAGDDFKEIVRVWPDGFRPDCVIHLAARVHVMHDTAADPLAAFRAVNVEATMRVAEAAARAGTRRFVYISSIKAVGEDSDPGRPLRESDPTHPDDPYGVSKREAELALLDLGERTGIEIVVIRPPLVYGPGVGANFLSLLRAVAKGWPLPLGKAHAPRSLVSVENLISAIVACANHPAAAGEIFHVSDGRDVSVAELISLIAAAMDRQARLLPVPTHLLRAAGAMTGKNETIKRLINPLRLDVNKLQTQLGWTPQSSVETALARTVAWYRSGSPSYSLFHP
jgi:nucleoside-diphosphate-sugar epimerase